LARLLIALLVSALMAAQSTADLTKVFDVYLAAVKAKDFASVMSVYRASVRKQVVEIYVTPKQQAEYMKSLAEMAPESFSEARVTANGSTTALLRFMGARPVPADVQKAQKLPPVAKMPMVVEFANEGGAWKMGPPAFGAEAPKPPADAKAPKDFKMGVRADYGEESVTQLGGPILRVEKQATGTVYVVRMSDQEIAAFVPAKLVLPGFVIGRAIQLQGAMHRKDPQKFWADAAKLFGQAAK